MKDHEFREEVNNLKELVLKYKDAQQLRVRLSTFLKDFKRKINNEVSYDWSKHAD